MLTISNLATSIPGQCQTAGYLAGPNEIAILSTDINYSSAVSFSTIYMSQWFNTGSSYTQAGSYVMGTVTANAWGSLHNQAQLELKPGSTYKFVNGVSASSATNVTLGNFTCRGLVMIFRKP